MLTSFIPPYLAAAASSGEEDEARSLRQDARPGWSGGHGRQGAGGAARRAGPVRDRKLRPLLAAAGLALATAAPVGSAAAATLVVDKSNPSCTDKGTGARLLHDRRRRRQDQPRRHRPGQGGHLQREGRHQALGRRGRGRHLRRRPRRHRHGPDRRLRPRERAVGHGAGVRGGSPTGSGLPTTTSYGLRALLSSNFTLANNLVATRPGTASTSATPRPSRSAATRSAARRTTAST